MIAGMMPLFEPMNSSSWASFMLRTMERIKSSDVRISTWLSTKPGSISVLGIPVSLSRTWVCRVSIRIREDAVYIGVAVTR